MWPEAFKYVRNSPLWHLAVGDVLQMLPGQQFLVNSLDGEECCKAGDEGTVNEFYDDPSGSQQFKIFWGRTEMVTTHNQGLWHAHFKYVRSNSPFRHLALGDVLQALP